MKITFNPSTVAALITPPNNKDITFDLRGQNIFARGVKFCGTDTNTWRDIKINNVSIDSNILDLRDGDNTTLTNINGVVTISSTWRPVVDNLTSDSTTSSLSANLGRVLKALIDGKSDSGHNHDDRYLRLTGGWMSGDIAFGGDNKIYWKRNTDSASISFKNDEDLDADSYMSFVTSDNGNEYFRWSHSSGSTNTEWMALRSDGLRVGGTKVSLEGHTHNDLYYTKTEVNNKLNGKSDTSHTHDDRYLKLTGGMLTGDLYINTNLYGPAVGNNPRNRYDSGLYFFNCNNSTTSTYNFGLYLWDNEFRFTYRTSADNLRKGNSFTIQGSDGQVIFTKTPKVGSTSISLDGHTHAYLPLSGGTMLGALNFANNTWNKVGNNVYMGDHNIGGQLCIMGANGTTGLSFHKYGDASIRKSITFDGNTLYMNGSCDYATLSNLTNLLAINTVPNKTTATSIGSWSPISGRYVFHQKWTDTSTGSVSANLGIYLEGNLTANMVLDGYYNSLLGFRVIGASGGFLKANGTIDNSTYLTSHLSLSNYYTKGEVDSQLSKYKLKSSIWVPETKIICSNFRDFLNKENLHKLAPEELNLYRFSAAGDESNYSSKYNYPVVDSHAMVFSIDGNNGYIRSMNFDLRSNDVYVTSSVANGEWRSWVRLLNTSDVAELKDNLTVHLFLSNTDTSRYPLIWGGGSHNNTSDSTGKVYKSHDVLSWLTSSLTLYATNIQTNNIKNLSVGGGIYWNPCVESASDGSDAASITLVKSGVAGGTTLVLSLMNDANDTILFQTNGSARLYHNSYPILTTLNTYVSGNKGYINGTEITLVNNADTLDGVHANQLCRIYTFKVHNSIIKVGTLTSGQLGHVCKLRFNSGIGYNASNNDKTMTVVIRASNGAPNHSGFYFEAHSESYRGGAFTTFYLHQTSKTQCELYMAAFEYSGQSTYEISFSDGDSWANEISVQNALPTSNIFTLYNYQIAYTDNNVATKLQTAREIWGQSFNGTADVNGTIYINNSNSSNGAIRLNNNVNSNARISAISDQVIFNTSNAIRFGETAWDFNQWAGLKYTHSNKTIYLGIADNSIFNATSALSGGTLNLRAGISNIHLNSGTSIIGLPTDGSSYNSRITLQNTSIDLTAGLGAKASIGSDFKIESPQGVYLNSRNSSNVCLCLGGGKVGIGTSGPLYELHVRGDTYTNGFGIIPYYLSDSISDFLSDLTFDDGHVYRCLNITAEGKMSCIIADKVPLPGNVRGFLIIFNQGYDGLIVLLKDLERYGSGNGNFWVMPSGCRIIKADSSDTLVNDRLISNVYNDDRPRFLVYSSRYNVWLEFYCSN